MWSEYRRFTLIDFRHHETDDCKESGVMVSIFFKEFYVM